MKRDLNPVCMHPRSALWKALFEPLDPEPGRFNDIDMRRHGEDAQATCIGYAIKEKYEQKTKGRRPGYRTPALGDPTNKPLPANLHMIH